jgi:hypothetical protein
MFPTGRIVSLVVVLAWAAAPLCAQAPDTASKGGGWVRRFPTIGGELDDRARIAQLLSGAPTDGFLIRSPFGQLTREAREFDWALIAPELDLTWNSDLPFSLNDGALRGGRGTNARLLAGAWLQYRWLSLLLAPELRYEQHREFEIPDFGAQARNGAYAPWYFGPRSADLPLRFGDESITRIDPGQSTLAVRVGPGYFGASTENQWWGPGIRNAIVMSNHAPGIPHLFLRTAAPLRSRIGTLEGKWMIGRLRESEQFDTLSANDVRALSGIVLTFRPAFDPDLTVGLARTVQASVDGAGEVPGRFADVLTRWNSGSAADSLQAGRGADQLLSLFGRWVFPEDGLEVYAELARQELPASSAEVLDTPGHSQGYTLGFQGARPIRGEDALRLQLELTYLEQTPRGRPVHSFYTSAAVPQGYTHGGQVIGASIGPGGSSQWIAADYLSPRWRAGIFGGRIRWDNDAFYTTPRATERAWAFLAHDVSVFGGFRGSLALSSLRIDAELITGTRYNFLFQNRATSFETADDAVDVRNHTLRLVVTPFGSRRRGPEPHTVAPLPPPLETTLPDTILPAVPDTLARPEPVAAPPGIVPMPDTLTPPDTAGVVETREVTPTPAGAARIHQVHAGETLFGIARRYGVTPEAIRVANGLRSDNIRAGDKLIIPEQK